MDRLAYALAADALEPGDALALQRAAHRPGLAARIAHAARALAATAPDTAPDTATDTAGLDAASAVAPGPWLVGDLGAVSLGDLHMDAGAWQPGDRLPVLLSADLPPTARLRVVVHTRAGAATLSPVAGVHVHLDQLRRTADGAWALDLVLADVPGLHRAVVEVLAPDEDTVLARAEVGVRLG